MTIGSNVHHRPWTLRSHAQTTARQVVTPSGTIIRGRFPSVTAHRMVAFEQLLELDALYLFEFCPLIVDILEQPFRFHYAFGNTTRRYTPDYALTLADGSRLIVEIKPRRSLAKPEIRAKFEAIQEAMTRQQHRFLMLTDEAIRREGRLANFKRLHPYLREPLLHEDRIALAELQARLRAHGALRLEECHQLCGDTQAVLRLLAHGLLRSDYMQVISSESFVSMPNGEVDHVLIDWF